MCRDRSFAAQRCACLSRSKKWCPITQISICQEMYRWVSIKRLRLCILLPHTIVSICFYIEIMIRKLYVLYVFTNIHHPAYVITIPQEWSFDITFQKFRKKYFLYYSTLDTICFHQRTSPPFLQYSTLVTLYLLLVNTTPFYIFL